MTDVLPGPDLTFDVGEPSRLLRDPIIRSIAAGTHRIAIAYFDTPDQALWRSGHTLDLTRRARRWVQTVRGDMNPAVPAPAGAWEQVLATAAPVLDPANAPSGRDIGQVDAAGLAPIFTVELTRTTREVVFEGADIRVVIERGTIRAPGCSAPIRRLVCELRGGDPAALFDFVRRLDGLAGLRLAVTNDPERGYALLQPAPPRPARTEPLSLDPAMSPAQVQERAIRACLRHYRRNEAILLEAEDPEAVHQARVALRRLRVALALFRPLARKDATLGLIDSEIRRIAAELGAVRSLDVLVAARKRLAPALAAPRELAFQRLRTELQSPRVGLIVLDLLQWMQARAEPDVEDADDRSLVIRAARALDRHRRRLKRRLRGIPEFGRRRLHRARIEAKRARYAAEFLASLWPSSAQREHYAAWSRELAHLQDHLGDLNDLMVAPRLLAELGIRISPRRSDERRAAKLRRDAARSARRLRALEPFWRE